MNTDERNQYIKDLEATRQIVIGEHDKSLLTLSAGALGVALAFFDKVKNLECKCMFQIALVLWTSCIVFVLLSFGASRMSHSRTIDEVHNDTFDAKRNRNPYDGLIPFFDVLAFLSFISGTVSFAVFLLKNT